jgi:hypothetical protein
MPAQATLYLLPFRARISMASKKGSWDDDEWCAVAAEGDVLRLVGVEGLGILHMLPPVDLA